MYLIRFMERYLAVLQMEIYKLVETAACTNYAKEH